MQIDTSRTSPNSVPRTKAIQVIVLHATVGSFASSLAWLCNHMSGVSTHYLIRKDGYIAQLVSDHEIAWHAGASTWGRFLNINDISLGIELENKNDGNDPYPPAQLDALAELVREKMATYHLLPAAIETHARIATPPGRKTDPAGLDLFAFRARFEAPPSKRYRSIVPATIFQDRRPDAPLWGFVPTGEVAAVDDVTGGWVHLQDGRGFSPVACWEMV